MKSTTAPGHNPSVHSNREQGKTHATWPKTKVTESATAKKDIKLPEK